MRYSFLYRNRVVLTAGALLLLAAHLLSTGVLPGQPAFKPAIALLGFLRPVQLAIARLADGLAGVTRDYTELVNARRENVRLREELARQEVQRTQLAELEAKNRNLSDLLKMRDSLAVHAVGAEVIGNDATGLSRTLLLEQGSDEGLRPGLAVVANQGAVGKIIAVGPESARVLLINDHNSALDAIDQRSRARGIIAGEVDAGLAMKYVGLSEDVKVGDTIVTSGLDGIFPRGVLVGKVINVGREGPGLFLDIAVAPAVDFRRLEQVLVTTEELPQPVIPAKG